MVGWKKDKIKYKNILSHVIVTTDMWTNDKYGIVVKINHRSDFKGTPWVIVSDYLRSDTRRDIAYTKTKKEANKIARQFMKSASSGLHLTQSGAPRHA